VEVDLLSHSAPSDDIRSLLTNAFTKENHFNLKNLLDMMRLEPEYEAVRDFTGHEFALLKQLRLEQLVAKRGWSQSEAVTTIIYNCAVDQLDNRALSLRKRGFHFIAKRLPGIDELLTPLPPLTGQRVVLTTEKSINDDKVNPDEEALMKNLFEMVRKSALKHRKQVFVVVYDFAASACAEIEPKSRGLLLRRWEGIKRFQNRAKKKASAITDSELAPAFTVVASQYVSEAARPLGGAGCSDGSDICTQVEGFRSAVAASISGPTSLERPSFATSPSTKAQDVDQGETEESTYTSSDSPAAPLDTTLAYNLAQWDASTETRLRLLDESVGKGAKWKWKLIHQEYLKQYPNSKMATYAVRMRLRRRHKTSNASPTANACSDSAVSPQVLQNVALATEPEPATTKRPAPACGSCR